ncbi:hypothetical protein PIB30_069002 [Stylosanthes scabra]|uniref:Uncharacterized protein n=1 Tax=Stylosanthes scabra TaxID=79078 RepID=A0ABU6UQI9_9FABA|nr:hypothetical protein [Stylosanthes scabra]
MGGCLRTLRYPILGEKSQSFGARDRRGSSSLNHARNKKNIYGEAAKSEKKVVTQEDWMESSSAGSNKHSKKKVHPCFNQSQVRRSLISEAADSLYLDRTMKHHQEKEVSSIVMRSLRCKSQRRVSFKLPDVVIFYSPDESSCKQASLSSSEDTDSDSITEDSFPSPNFGSNSMEEPVVRLAVETLPHVCVFSNLNFGGSLFCSCLCPYIHRNSFCIRS